MALRTWIATLPEVDREAARLLQTGAASVDVAITHALLADDAIAVMQAAGIRHLWSTDAIAHPSNVVSLVPLLAAALR